MKAILKFTFALFVTLFAGTGIGHAIGVDPSTSMPVAVGASAVYSLMPNQAGAINQVVLTQLFTAEFLNKFRHEHSWVSEITDRSEWVGNDVIRLNDIGDDPKVLINNNTYPIGTVSRTDTGILISLNKYETENTSVHDDELYGLPYDKPGSVQRQHRETLEEFTAEHGLHICAPQANTTETPVLETTGADDGTGRKRLLSKDIADLKKRLDDTKVPKQGRILVLCNEHINDLLNEDKPFTVQYQNHTMGAIANMYYGFKVYESAYNPVYNASNEKKAFGAASAGTDRNASVCLYAPRVIKAMGTIKFYHGMAEVRPEERDTVMGYKLWNIIIPKKYHGMGAIVSAPTS
jgi:hypothetical protein